MVVFEDQGLPVAPLAEGGHGTSHPRRAFPSQSPLVQGKGDNGNDDTHPPSGSITARASSWERLEKCNLCGARYPTDQLTFQLTVNMMIETRSLLLQVRSGHGTRALFPSPPLRARPICCPLLAMRRMPRAVSQTLDWLRAPIMSSTTSSSSSRYTPLRVCRLCYALFERVQGLRKVEVQLACSMGVPLAQHDAETLTQRKPTVVPSVAVDVDPVRDGNWSDGRFGKSTGADPDGDGEDGVFGGEVSDELVARIAATSSPLRNRDALSQVPLDPDDSEDPPRAGAVGSRQNMLWCRPRTASSTRRLRQSVEPWAR